MATKTSKLHTSFTGDDKQFQRTAGRVMKSGTQMGAMAGRLKGAFAAMGGAMVVSGIINKFARLGKVAKRVGMSAEEVQRLAHAADLTGTSFETLQGIMTRLQRRIGEALQNPASAAAQAFNELGLSAMQLRDMGLKEQFFAVADAFKATGGGVEGTASLMKLLDTEVRNLIPLFQEGATGIQTMMDAATVATDKTIEEIEKVKDKFTELANVSGGTFANIFAGVIDGVKSVGKGIAFTAGMAKALVPGGQTPEEFRQAWQGTAQAERDDKERKEDAKEDAKRKKERKEADITEAKERFGGEVWQTRIGQAFGEKEKEEDLFAEIIAALEERWKPAELGKQKQKKEEAEQKILSGQFSECLSTAGLGGTGYLRKTPEVVQLEKQTKISEDMLQSLNEFNSSMGIVADNTVDR